MTTAMTVLGFRHYLMLALGLACFGLLMAAASQRPTRVAVVDPDRLRRDAASIRDEMAKAAEPAQGVQRELKAKQDALAKALQEYNAQKSVTTESVNRSRSAAMEKQSKEIQELNRRLSAMVAKAEKESVAPMRERVAKVVSEIARERGIDVILPASGVIYNTSEMDLTDEVIARLDGAGGKK
jgi:outer membrane protein